MNKTTGSAEALYTKLSGQRFPYIKRGRDASALTIPSILPAEGHNGASALPTPYQSVGARGVNNLAAALLLSLLPPNSPFFRLVVEESAMAEVTAQAWGVYQDRN